ncbi:hypothetical protein ACJX0J_017144, partial [Zea mays]
MRGMAAARRLEMRGMAAARSSSDPIARSSSFPAVSDPPGFTKSTPPHATATDRVHRPHLPAWRPCCSPPWKGRVHKRQGRAPARPRATAAALDVWTSEPAPVQERRRKLLQMLGLAGDPALARLEMGRSVSYDDGPVPVRPTPASPPISRSRSDGGAVPALATKPPLGGRSPGSSEATPEGEEEEEADPRCLIRNLDDGSEFVVKEGSELREVGTGRQLTMKEFVDLCVGHSPIVQELMRRENVASSGSSTPVQRSNSDSSNGATRHRRRRLHSSWLRGIQNVAGSVVASSRDCRSSDDKDTCSEKGGRRSSSATDDSQDSAGAVRHGPVRVKVRQYGKSYKEFSGLFMNQEIQAHDGSIWSIRFSPDGRYLASAGEDCVIHVWEVSERLSMEGESDAPDRRPSLHGRGVLSIRVRAVHGRNLAVSASPLGFPPLYCQGHCLGEDCLFLCGETKALKSYSEAIQNTLQLGYKAEMAKGLGIGCTYGIARMSWALVFWCVSVFIGNGLTDGLLQVADYEAWRAGQQSNAWSPISDNGNRVHLRLYYKCLEAGLISKQHDDKFQEKEDHVNPVSMDVQRLHLLFDVAVQNNLTSLICHYITDVCLDENAVSSVPLLAFLLDEVVIKDWCKKAVNALITEIGVIYKFGLEMMRSKLSQLQKFATQLAGIYSVLEVMVSSFTEAVSAHVNDLHQLIENTLKANQ